MPLKCKVLYVYDDQKAFILYLLMLIKTGDFVYFLCSLENAYLHLICCIIESLGKPLKNVTSSIMKTNLIKNSTTDLRKLSEGSMHKENCYFNNAIQKLRWEMGRCAAGRI